MQIRIYYEDTDCMGIVYHTNYLKYCERARSEMFFSADKKEFLEEYNFVLREVKAVFKSPARLGDLIDVKTKYLNYDKYCIYLEQELYKEQLLLFKAQIKLAVTKDNKLFAIDDKILSLFKEK
ncbi:YbgC/FadM family acyl-CoA thioesterase [Campylobacter canadensis]|uniref:YbgC/FadM family acyl-CoA thioesterase n=1 Tax=Campylobacter canadensis TaxID=449520 RepID=A0ABS7WRV0_9BACT|nr:YbgC/FadM family acyl-CoA thioesterase [Campylobacter canadensis]MBZ7987480.1 YbgC/FadM family acyl-CoA thioesterase [Campylobacter canadensis]MBZ7994823.1 YbgC/FadM family acyl-CoA thioesterase [Campylobacter canadensis]MBZ7996392.1 YbgC/FadM family acyl-CoA thioesterase [Campylobacter canadensis]MBZ7998426.1 YbgC/FadM family acyl-CoA thioesterase [Campylobacter canadensis]MBZ8000140.1 YbgC/FadM family acyl-CoA thioesterase [Campylobacter canadensis]